MSFHEWRTIWTPRENQVLHVRMESTNKKDKFAVAVFGHKNSVVGHLMNRKSGRFVKAVFYFLPASEYHRCKFCVTGKAVNQGDNKGMKIPYILIIKRQSEFMDIFSQYRKEHI